MLEETRQRESKAFDQVISQGKNALDFMQDLVRKQNDLAIQREREIQGLSVQREREIRQDMKQLAASEARVAALEQKLQDQASLSDPKGDAVTRRERDYFSGQPPKSWTMPWCPLPVFSEPYAPLVLATVPRGDWYDYSLIPSSSLLDDTSYTAMGVFACRGVSTDTTTVSIVKARASVPTLSGAQQSLLHSVCPTVQQPTTVSTSVICSSNLTPVVSQRLPPGSATPMMATGNEGPMFTLPYSSAGIGPTPVQTVPLVSASEISTAAVPGQMLVLLNSSVSTPLVDATVLVAPPPAAIAPAASVTAGPSIGTISVIPSVSVGATPVSNVPVIAPSSIASSLPVGTSVSSSSASPSQPSYPPACSRG